MNRSWIWIIALVAVLAIGLLYFLFSSPANKVNWSINFREADRQPYGLNLISKLLDDYFPDQSYSVHHKPIKQELKSKSGEKQTYVFIGARLYLNTEDEASLLHFIEAGNDAFISAQDLPYSFLQQLFGTEEYYSGFTYAENKKAAYLNFTHPDLRQSAGYTCDYVFMWKNNDYYWQYFDDSVIYSAVPKTVRLGFFNDQKTNFIKIKYGEGNAYLHTTPLIFTNYHLKNNVNMGYADKVFSHLSASSIYWDEFSKVPQFSQGDVGNNETPLRYILSQPALKWAWYVMLIMVGLFLLFRIKRDQRMIPVLNTNSNTSLEFIQTISRLYYMQNDHSKLVAQKIKLFLSFIRSRYGISTKEIDDSLINKLSVKSQVEKRKISDIFEQYKTLNNMREVEPENLQHFHQALDEFYKSCK